MGVFKDEGVVYKPVNEVNLSPDSDELYLSPDVKAPRMAGSVVKVFSWLLELPILGGVLLYFLKKNNLIHKLVSFAEIQEPPLFVPSHPYQETNEQEVKFVELNSSPPEKVQQAMDCLNQCSQEDTKPRTVLDYARAYTSAQTTPTMVAKQLISHVRESSRQKLRMSFFINFYEEDILKQAAESTLRYQRGEPISVLDGVPIAIKDEIDCMPYPTTGGTTWIHKVRKVRNDACCVSRLRSCGAIIIGKTNMHELGAGISGINPHYGPARNPYDKTKITGGSSSGSAAVVASGLCPIALGVDGGGSVRLPAALCGVVGLKPTFERIPHEGVLPINHTVGMIGILAATVEDALIAYAAVSGEISSDHTNPKVNQPKLSLPLLKSANYGRANIKMARYGKWFDDCTDDIRVCCSEAVSKLSEKYGWKTVEVTLPELETMRLSHYLTIGSECSNSIAANLEKNKDEMGADVRVGLSVYGSFHSHEYLNAQKVRYRQLKFHEKIFSVADVIVTPTVGVTAYSIKDDALKTGELDYVNGAALVRFQIAGNFLGLPAVTIPVGYDKSGMPIGLQLIGKPWSESLLIYMASAVQAECMSGYKRPEVFYEMLQKG